MRATFLYGAGDVRVEDAPDPVLREPTDAIVRIVRSCVCGTDLHPYRGMPAGDTGTPMGHEFVGTVEEIGAEVSGLRPGDLVVAPFAWSDNTCDFCRAGLHTACRNGGILAVDGDGAQAEAIRIPQAQGTLVRLPVGEDSALLPSLLTLADVYATGYHGARQARVSERTTVAVIGDGAVGLLAVLSARRLGAERIILMGRHKVRTDLGREFGATDVISERGEEGVALLRELTGGDGAHAVVEAVGHRDAYDTAVGVVRPGGVISRLGLPQYEASVGFADMFLPHVTLTGGPAPVRAYVEELLPDVLDGTVEPGLVFDQTRCLADTPDAYRAMDRRDALKVIIRP